MGANFCRYLLSKDLHHQRIVSFQVKSIQQKPQSQQKTEFYCNEHTIEEHWLLLLCKLKCFGKLFATCKLKNRLLHSFLFIQDLQQGIVRSCNCLWRYIQTKSTLDQGYLRHLSKQFHKGLKKFHLPWIGLELLHFFLCKGTCRYQYVNLQHARFSSWQQRQYLEHQLILILQ